MSVDTSNSSNLGNSAYICYVISAIEELNSTPLARSFLEKLLIVHAPDYDQKIKELITKEEVKQAVWSHVLFKWNEYGAARTPCFQALIYHGVPDEYRPSVWKLLAMEEDESGYVSIDYQKCILEQSEYDDIIKLDIPRTFPEVLGFCEQDQRILSSLYNVVKAYSTYDEEIGYCQGVAFIAGLLLMHLNELDAFALLVKLMCAYKLRDMYHPDMLHFGIMVYQFEALLEKYIPALADHLKKQDFALSVVCSHFLTIMCNLLPLPHVFWIMDILFYEGFDIVPKCCLSLLQLNQDRLINSNLEDLTEFFHSETKNITDNDWEQLILITKGYTFDQKLLKRLEKEYLSNHTKLQKEIQETSVFKNNVMLKEKLALMEKENREMAELLLNEQLKSSATLDRNEKLETENKTLRNSVSSHFHEDLLEPINLSDVNSLQYDNTSFDSGVESTYTDFHDDDKEWSKIDLQSSSKGRYERTAQLERHLLVEKLHVEELNNSLEVAKDEIRRLYTEWEKHEILCDGACIYKNHKQHSCSWNELSQSIKIANLKILRDQAVAQERRLRNQLISVNEAYYKKNMEMSKLQEDLDLLSDDNNLLKMELKNAQIKLQNIEAKRAEDDISMQLRKAEDRLEIANLKQELLFAKMEMENIQALNAISRIQLSEDMCNMPEEPGLHLPEG